MQAWSNKSSRRCRGVSLIELLIVVAIILIIAKFSLMQIQGTLKNSKVQTGLQTTVEQMRKARQLAMDKRMVHVISFCANTPCQAASGMSMSAGTIRTESLSGGVFQLVSTLNLPADVAFTSVASMPTTGPDGFGAGKNPMEFDCTSNGCNAGLNSIYFYPDGSGQDQTENYNNAVIYVARANELASSRAVTLLGATGRIKSWRLAGGTWQ